MLQKVSCGTKSSLLRYQTSKSGRQGLTTFLKTQELKGFLLFEALIAILIASVSLVILLQGIGGALRASNISGDYFKASLLAGAQLALLEKEESGVEPGSENGRFGGDLDPNGNFSWSQNIKKIASTGLFGIIELKVCEVSIKVEWKERTGERNVTFVTYLHKYEPSGAER